jgi:hypothetical protein
MRIGDAVAPNLAGRRAACMHIALRCLSLKIGWLVAAPAYRTVRPCFTIIRGSFRHRKNYVNDDDPALHAGRSAAAFDAIIAIFKKNEIRERVR